MGTFLWIWLGQLISVVGSGLTSFALAVWMFERTGLATPFALTVLAGSLPRVILAPIAGVVADRHPRRLLMMLSDSGNAVITLVTFFLFFQGLLQVWMVYLLVFTGSIFSAFQEPAYSASVTMLVPGKHLARANGLIQTSQAMETLLSPILAGFLFISIGINGILLIDFVTFLFAVSVLFLVRIPQPARSTAQVKGTVWKDALFGWRYLRFRPGLFGLLLFYALVNFFLNFAAVLTGPLVLSFSQADGLGIVQAIWGAGMLVGSLLLSIWGGFKRRIPMIFFFIGLASVGLFIAGLRASILVISLGFFLLCFSVPLAAGPSAAVFQSKVALDVQGRVFAIRGMISRSIMPVAFLLAGPLADKVFGPLLTQGGGLAETVIGSILGVGPGRGIGLMFCLSALLLGIVTLVAYSRPRIRRVEEELPDVLPVRENNSPVSR